MATPIIKRNDGKYVSRQGSKHSYTDRIENARRYDSREAAKIECCENERVTTIEEELEI